MAAPTYSFNTIAASQCDADSPVDETLMESIRQNLIHLEEWLGDSYTAAKNHDHDGVNSASVVLGTGVVVESKIGALAVTESKIGPSAVAQSKLKTSQGSVSGSGNHTLPGGEYGFYPQVKCDDNATPTPITAQIGLAVDTHGSYVSNIYLDGVAGVYSQQRYVTSSGKEHWLFLIYDKKAKKVLQAWEAPDHPSYGNGDIEHPFNDYRGVLPVELEMILLDMDSIEQIKAEAELLGIGILEYVNSEKFTLNMDVEIPFFKRDMDGTNDLEVKPDCYVVRSIV